MRKFVFPAYCYLGNLNYGEVTFEAELTDREAKKLTKYGTKAKIYHADLENCKKLKKLYDRLYPIAIELLTEEVRDSKLVDEKNRNNPAWRADDTYECGVDFPEEFEELLEYDD